MEAPLSTLHSIRTQGRSTVIRLCITSLSLVTQLGLPPEWLLVFLCFGSRLVSSLAPFALVKFDHTIYIFRNITDI